MPLNCVCVKVYRSTRNTKHTFPFFVTTRSRKSPSRYEVHCVILRKYHNYFEEVMITTIVGSCSSRRQRQVGARWWCRAAVFCVSLLAKQYFLSCFPSQNTCTWGIDGSKVGSLGAGVSTSTMVGAAGFVVTSQFYSKCVAGCFDVVLHAWPLLRLWTRRRRKQPTQARGARGQHGVRCPALSVGRLPSNCDVTTSPPSKWERPANSKQMANRTVCVQCGCSVQPSVHGAVAVDLLMFADRSGPQTQTGDPPPPRPPLALIWRFQTP